MQEHIGKTCPYCQYAIKPDVTIIVCPGDCKMPHHKECWDENGGCTTFGCSASPAMSGRSHSPTQPVSTINIDETSNQQGVIDNSISQNGTSSNTNAGWFIGISVVVFLFVFFAAISVDNEKAKDNLQSNNSAENVSDNVNDATGIRNISWDNGTYIGQLNNVNIPHGEGEWSNRKGEKYVGEWKDGKKHGQGTYIWADGREYTGDWLNDHRNGHGHWINPNKGYEYEGGWRNGYFHGKGVFIINTSQGQEIYEGEYRNNKKHGYGEWFFPDGTIYVGQHKDGMKHGEGELTYPDERIKVGTWDNNLYIEPSSKHAENTIRENQNFGAISYYGGTYEGELLNGLPHGYGSYTWTDGTEFEGTWANGKRHGVGILYDRDGTSSFGVWNQAKLIWHRDLYDPKISELYYGNEIYVGETVNNVPHGQGMYIWPDGEVYVGNWLNGMLHGDGTYIYINGSSANAKWSYGERLN